MNKTTEDRKQDLKNRALRYLAKHLYSGYSTEYIRNILYFYGMTPEEIEIIDLEEILGWKGESIGE